MKVSTAFYADGRQYPADLEAQVADAPARVEAVARLKLRNPAKPPLVTP
jgi:hypothetical protein